ncbi:MAG: gliding motility-associated C-terminal domain-containing protein [Bacteroidetes bacterium]|nr:gliding motility-associated C-terminal domain-containing protein [Bacteroidota bacterium]
MRFNNLIVSTFFLLFTFSAFTQNSWLNTNGGAVNLGDLDVSGDKITVEAIITVTNNSSANNIVSKHHSPADVNYLLRPGSFEVTTTNGYKSVVNSVSIPLNTPTHVAATYDGTVLCYYTNGCLTGTMSCSGTMVQNAHNTSIGSRWNYGAPDELFYGYIDEVRIWNAARTQTQIRANMNTLPTYWMETNLIAYYDYDFDFSNQKNFGVWTGTATATGATRVLKTYNYGDIKLFNESATTEPLFCNGSGDGQITAMSWGGNQNHQYALNNGVWGTSNTFANLTPGTYTVSARSAEADPLCTKSVVVNISQPSVVAINGSVTNVLCNGNSTGAITTSVTGGTTPYSYLWSPSNATTNFINTLSAGNYTVNVNDNVCVPIGPELLINRSFTSGNTGFTSDYNYATFDMSNDLDETSIIVETDPDKVHSVWTALTDHTTGNGNLLVVNGSSVSTNRFWIQNAILASNTNYSFSFWAASTYSGNPAVVRLQLNGVDVGSAQTLPALSNTWTKYSITFNSGAITTCTLSLRDNNATAVGNDFVIDDLSLRVCSYNCKTAQTYTVTEPAVITSTISSTSVVCNGQANGAAIASVAGGVANYQYNWGTGYGTSNSISTLAAGNYSVTVRDANNCTIVKTYTVTQPSALSSTVSSTNVLCFGGSSGTASVASSGGNGGYLYSWSNAATTSFVNNLTSGIITVTTTDTKGCTVTRTVSITQPLATLTGSISTIPSGCNSSTGSATANFAGGTGAYTYLWSNLINTQTATALSSGIYSITVTDANACSAIATTTLANTTGGVASASVLNNISCFGTTTGSASASIAGGTGPFTYLWSNSQTTQNITGVAAGTYTVTITDANLCSSTSVVSITEPSAAVSATVTMTGSLTCSGSSNASLVVAANGGVPGYTYTLLPINSSNTNGVFSNLSAGTYTIVVADANSCSAIAVSSGGQIVITQPAPITLTLSASNNLSCFGNSTGQITASATGGTGSYTFQLNPGSTTNSSGAFTGLSSGTYSVVVSDGNNCNSLNTLTVSISQPSQLLASSGSVTDESCSGVADGAASVVASGGSGGLVYKLFPGSISNSNGNFTGLTSGTYTVTVEDANNCSASYQFPISVLSTGVVLATNDYDSTLFNEVKSVYVFGNDNGNNANNIVIIDNPKNGTIVSNANGYFEYKPNSGFSGEDSIAYQLCDLYCTLKCDTAKVYLKVLSELVLSIPNGFSPDGDGINDTYVLKNLSRFGNGNNTLEIFNRWGDKVYEAKPYKNDWDGTPNKGLSIGNGKVVSGTYFYVLIIEGMDPYKGYLEIRR